MIWSIGHWGSLMAIREARLEPLALSVTGHERAANGCAAASGEEKFDSPEALKEQILRDVAVARRYFRRVRAWIGL